MNNKITVIGAGTMGSGIAQMAVEAGFTVTLVDTDEKFIERGVGNIKNFIGKKLPKEKSHRNNRMIFCRDFQVRRIWGKGSTGPLWSSKQCLKALN